MGNAIFIGRGTLFPIALEGALKLKEINPDIDIYILFRDMRTYGFKEDYYREAAGP